MEEEATNQQGTQTTVHQTTEVVDSSTGGTITSGSGLSKFFDKIESGKSARDATEELKHEQAQPPAEGSGKSAEAEEKKKEASAAGAKSEDGAGKEPEQPNAEEKKAEAGDLRAKLRAEEASRAEVSKAESGTAKDKEAGDGQDIDESELQVLPHDKPKTVRRIQALLAKIERAQGEAATAKKEIEAKAARLAELESQLAKTKTVDPETQKRLDAQTEELAMFRRRYELDKDPEIKSRFETRAAAAETAIETTILRYKGGKELMELVKAEGGWSKFAGSNRQFVGPDGKSTSGAEVAEAVYSALNLADRRAIDAAVLDQIQAQRERDRFYEDETKKATEYFKKQEEDRSRSAADHAKQVAEAQKSFDEWRKRSFESEEFLKEKAIPDAATEEQKKAIAEDNAFAKQLQELLVKSLSPNGVGGMQEILLDSVRYYAERRASLKKDAVIKALQDQLAAKQEEFDKYKNAGKSTPRAGSIAAPAGGDQKPKAPTSFKEALDMAAAGVNLRELVTK
jgi:hypothetical protein